MTGLLRAEVRRLTSRRLARILAVLFVAILLLIQVVGAAQSKEGGEAYDRAVAEARQNQEEGRRFCEELIARDEAPEGLTCEGSGELYVEDPRYRADEVLPGMATGLAVAAAIVAFLVGASFVGAEWHAGTMQALLFWEPRRQRVVIGKAVALVAVLLAFTAFVQLLGWATTMLVASTRGTTEGVTGGLQQAAFLTMLRGMIVVAFTGLLGYAVAGLARVTGAALGAAFVYFAILENIVRSTRPGWTRFLVTENITAVMQKSIDVPAAKARDFSDFFGSEMYRLTGVRGTVTLAVYLVLLVGAFAVSFSRRDVT